MKLTLVGTGITLPHVDETALRYNLANAHLEAYVRGHAALGGVDVTRVDAPYSLDTQILPPDVVERVLATAPDVLGLSCYSWDIESQLALAATVKAARPTTRVILGGPSATFDARRLLLDNAAVDIVVRGEGEETLAELLQLEGHDLAGVAGVSWRAPDGSLREEPDRPPVADLATLRSPLLTGVLVPPRQNLMFEFSRGCIYRCKYCAWKIGGGGVRYVPRERVDGEVAWARERGYEHAFIIDSALNNHDDRLQVVSDAVARHVPDGALAFSYFVNYRFVSPLQARLLGRIRAHEVNVGLESTNPAALKAAGRAPVDEDAFGRALDLLADVAPATLHLMLGMPGDDLAGFRRTLDFVARQAERSGKPRVRSVRVHWMLVAPGSTIWEHADRHGVEIRRQGVPYVVATRDFPQGDLVKALRALREHPRADLFVWEDAEPLKMLGGDVPDMFAAGGDHIGGRAPRRIADEEVLHAIRPLAPGRAMPRGWTVRPLEHRHGWPVIVLDGPARRQVLLQVRPRDAEPSPYLRTATFDLVWLPSDAPSDDTREEQQLVKALAELVARNDTGSG